MLRLCRWIALGLLLLPLAAGCNGGGGTATGFRVTATVPPNGATGIATSIAIRFTFNRSANPTTLAVTVTPSVATTAAWSNANTVLTLTPGAALAENTAYQVDLTALQSETGVALSGTTRLRFTTVNPAAGEFVVYRFTGGAGRPPLLAFNRPAKPAKGASVADPVYHTTITRVTDKAVDHYEADAIENEYSRFDPENSDGTRLILRGTDGTWYLYSLPSYALVRQVDFSGNPDPEPRWDATNPDVLYYVAGPALRAYNAATNSASIIHTFTDVEPQCAFARTHFEGDASLNRRYWCLELDNASFSPLSVVCYDKQADAVVGRLTHFPTTFDNVSMDMSGTHCLIAYDTTPPIAYQRDFTAPVSLPAGSSGHADFALDASGRDVYVYQNTATDFIAMADLDTGAETELVPIPFDQNLDIGLHFSGNSDAKRGWVLVSTYGQSAVAKSWMDRSLFMVQLRDRPLVWRVAQTFTLQGADADYFAEAFATINRAGTHIYWGSNWNATGAGSHAYDTFVPNLPTDWDTQITALGE